MDVKKIDQLSIPQYVKDEAKKGKKEKETEVKRQRDERGKFLS